MIYSRLCAPVKTAAALGGFLPRAYLVVIELVFLSDRHRRQIRHDHICAVHKPTLPAIRRYRSERCGGWYECLREHQSQHAYHHKGLPDRSLLHLRKWRLFMWNIRSDPYHLRLQLRKEMQILSQIH